MYCVIALILESIGISFSCNILINDVKAIGIKVYVNSGKASEFLNVICCDIEMFQKYLS